MATTINYNNPDIDDYTCIQWNCQGLRNKKDELAEIIRIHKPALVSLQETKLRVDTNFCISNYNFIRSEGHFNYTPHGGVAILVHESVPYSEVELNTTLQAVAVTVHLEQTVTVCSVYISRSHVLNETNLVGLLNQLPSPYVVMGDFNGYNQLWGSNRTDGRGRIIEAVINRLQINILNDGAPTRIAYHAETAIDLTLCSPVLTPILQWSVDSSPGDSDHCPILITLMSNIRFNTQYESRMNFKKADWQKYQNSRVWNDLPNDIDTMENGYIIEDLYHRFDGAVKDAVPTYKVTKFYPKPWWSNELKESKKERERMYQRYRSNTTENNFINWKKARAIHKAKIVKHKKDSWIKLASTFQKNTPTAVVYENIRKIKGKTQRKINMLRDGAVVFSSASDIANRFSEHFYISSSNNNYSTIFKQYKIIQEHTKLNFFSNNSEIYNSPFTVIELEETIKQSRSSSMGTDKVSYDMIQKMPPHAKEYCVGVFNKFWRSSFFPSKWRESIIVPFLKPGKDSSKPENYRPISLTSSLCKTLERMVNNRLTTFMEMNGVLNPVQCGGLRNRSTEDHLIRMETEIRKAFFKNEHYISVFFDIEKAYDTAWRYGIMRDLHRMGLRGNLPKFIEEFLNDRTFKVRIGECLSGSKVLEAGIPQGSVLSPTLFIIKMNSLTDVIPKEVGYHTSLYVDDLQVAFHHQDLNHIKIKLQHAIDKIVHWADYSGFRLSVPKTKAIHFSIIPGLFSSPDLNINNQRLEYSENAKFLGLVWDHKLTWRPQITSLKVKCIKLLGLLRSVTSQHWGADQSTLLQLYRSLIRSKLDYGCITYNSASKTDLKVLDSVANDAIRLATGAFKSTPVDSLQVLANEMPLHLRRDTLTLKYFYKVKSQLNNPAFKQAIPTNYNILYRNKNLAKPFPFRAHSLIDEFDMKKNIIKPSFSYRMLDFQQPIYKLSFPDINLDLSEMPKTSTSNIEYLQSFRYLCEAKYSNSLCIYTDGSKTADGVGAAAVAEGIVRTATLPCEASIFSAELHAIFMATHIIEESRGGFYTIFSDSHSALLNISKVKLNHPVVLIIKHRLHRLIDSGKRVNLCWIPGHVGIKGNEKADIQAKRASRRPVEAISVYYRDMYPNIKEKIQNKWNQLWSSRGDKLLQIKSEVGEWKEVKKVTRREEVVINRVRLGHTNLTHNYIMQGGNNQMAPICPVCGNARLTIEHVFLTCQLLGEARKRCFTLYKGNQAPNLLKLLGDGANIQEILKYLKYIHQRVFLLCKDK